MEISAMVNELKNELVSVTRDLKTKEETADKYRKLLAQVESEITPLRDQFDALKMALDALELVSPSAQSVRQGVADIVLDAVGCSKPEIRNIHHSRMPKKIGKFNPKGKKIGEYASINKCAKEFGWSNSSMAKYIESTGRDKQIRLRGYYLEFIAA